MNGRAYDYNLGRFLSVDPFIQFPSNSQSLNPYTYILNNPMAGVDPTGYCVGEQSIQDCADSIEAGQSESITIGGDVKGTISKGSDGSISITTANGAEGQQINQVALESITGIGSPTSVGGVSGALAVAGTMAISDGPLPYGDAAAVVFLIGASAVLATGAAIDYFTDDSDDFIGIRMNTDAVDDDSDGDTSEGGEGLPDFEFDDPSKPPVSANGKGWVWKGPDSPGGERGAWVNPDNPKESLHPDLDHGDPIGPHWDFNDRKSRGSRVHEDGKVVPKSDPKKKL